MHNYTLTHDTHLENPPDSAGRVESKLGMVVIDDHMSVVTDAHLRTCVTCAWGGGTLIIVEPCKVNLMYSLYTVICAHNRERNGQTNGTYYTRCMV